MIVIFEDIISKISGNIDVLNNYVWVFYFDGKNDKVFEIVKWVVELNVLN